MNEQAFLRARFMHHRAALESILDLEESCAQADMEDIISGLRDGAFYNFLGAIGAFVRSVSITLEDDIESFEDVLEQWLKDEAITQEAYEFMLSAVMVLSAVSDPEEEAVQLIEVVRDTLPLYAEQLTVLYTTMERLDSTAAASH